MIKMLALILLVMFFPIFLVSSEAPPFINLTKITYTSGIDIVKFQIDLKGYRSKISCPGFSLVDQLTCKCSPGSLVKGSVSLVSETVYYLVPLNVTCGSGSHEFKTVANLTLTNTNSTAVKVSWRAIDKRITKYVIYFMNEDTFHHELKTTNRAWTLFEVPQGTKWYQICIATAGDKGSMSRYICQQALYVPPLLPVADLKVRVSDQSATVTWERSSYTELFHLGYVVNLTSQSGVCKTTIINMKHFCVSTPHHCTYPTIVRWTSLMPLRLDNLVPNTNYQVSVAALSSGQISVANEIAFTTKSSDLTLVNDIRVSIQNKFMFIQFQYPYELESTVVKFVLKVVLLRVNMCSYQHKNIFYGIISTSSKLISVDCLTDCCEYFISVKPVKICNDVFEKNGTSTSKIFKPKLRNSDPLVNVNAYILSNNLLKINWSNPILNDNCENFGFIVHMYNNKYCKTWIVTSNTCSEFKKEHKQDMICTTNNEYLKITDGLVKTHLLLTGEFTINVLYTVKIVRLTEKNDFIYHKDIQFSVATHCFNDCYFKNYTGISAVAVNSQICKPWKDFSQFPSNLSTRENFCHLDKKLGSLPVCINDLNGSLLNCSVPACPHGSNNIPCVREYTTIYSPTSVTIRWQSPRNSNKKINGYITLLYNLDWQCQRYELQLRTDDFNILKMSPALQSFLISCKSGSISHNWNLETKFDDLKPNEEFVVYIIPLVDSQTYGELSRIFVGTTVSESISPNYMTIRTERDSIHIALMDPPTNSSYAVSQIVSLMKNDQIEVVSAKFDQKVVELQNLDICTVYCAYIFTVYKFGFSLMTDKNCIRTPAPVPSGVEIFCQSGPQTNQLISWRYLGNDDCEKSYNVILRYRYSQPYTDRPFITSETSHHFKNLDIGLIYIVFVRTQMIINMKKEVIESQSWASNEFYVGELNPKLSNVSTTFDTTKKTLTILWNLYGTSIGAFFHYLIRVQSNGKCHQTVLLKYADTPVNQNLNNINADVRTTFLDLARCEITREQHFKYLDTMFRVEISTNKTKINGKINIYGLNLIGLFNVYETLI